MEAEIRYAKRRKHIEGDIRFEFGGCHLIRHDIIEPGAIEGLTTKRIVAWPDEVVPVTHGEAQVVFKPFAQDLLIRIIVTKA